ncbi:MAG: DegT/DnrJ/EryC1/StrS family aminotransferase [Nitrospirae bacterium]|nr:DegT/DnrJ/EryC1/StrS family aminotransferase [Nitrospirota bacterium]
MEATATSTDYLDRTSDFKVSAVKVQRHLPPTAAPLGLPDLVKGVVGLLRPARACAKLESELKSYFGVRHVFLLTSGKAALATVLKSMKARSSRRQVIIPAYTCYSVPAAVHKAGLEVVLCDVNPHSLDFDLAKLQATVGENTLAIVTPHLFGQPADLKSVTAIAKPSGVFVIEDAAQAMGGRDRGQWLGTQGDVGFFSLGRGKNVSAGSGGVIVTNSDSVADGLSIVYKGLPVEPVSGLLANALTVVATKMLLHPLLYWLPAGLPFLGLGETKYSLDYPVCRMDGMRAGLLSSWRSRLEESNRCRIKTSQLFRRRLPLFVQTCGADPSDQSAYLRLPLLLPTAQQKAALCLIAKNCGLGVSASYPAPVSMIPEVASTYQSQRFPGAEALAARLVTLPLHCYVTEDDVDRIAMAVSRFSGEAKEAVAQGYKQTCVSAK